MYTQIIDPVLGTMEIDYDLDAGVLPADSLFTIPANYSPDSLLALSSSGLNCTPQLTLDPVILVSSGSRPGRTVLTAITNGGIGCGFDNSTIAAGRTVNAVPLTPRNLPIYQLLLSDNQGPQYSTTTVDFARVTLTTYDGSTSNSLIIRISVP